VKPSQSAYAYMPESQLPLIGRHEGLYVCMYVW